jgi:carbon storage regulator CsrA
MLLFSRKPGQRLVLGDGLEVTVVSVGRRAVRLAVVAPSGVRVVRGEVFDRVRAANATMCLEGTPLGTLEVGAGREIGVPAGLLGFPTATRFVLLEVGRRPGWGYLQAVDVPQLSFPVIDPTVVPLGVELPTPAELARSQGMSGEDAALLVVVAERAAGQWVANVLAPIVVDVGTRQGVQVVLDPRRFSAQHPLVAGGREG